MAEEFTASPAPNEHTGRSQRTTAPTAALPITTTRPLTA